MIRLRRASVIATLSLLAWTATASAECGWVLWEISSPSVTNREWSYDKIAAEASNDACKQRAEIAIQRRTLQGRLHGWTIARGDANRLTYTKVDPPDQFFADFDCWPDTVDPRRPKGK